MQRSRKVVPLKSDAVRTSTRLFEYKGYWIDPVAGSANWYVFWYEPEKRSNARRSLRTPDLDEAKKRVINLVDAHQEIVGEHGDAEAEDASTKRKRKEPDQVLLRNALDEYWDEHGKDTAAASTQAERLGFWREFFDPATTVADVDPRAIQAFAKYLRKTHNHSNATIDRTLVVGRAAINRLKDLQTVTWVPKIKLVQTQEEKDAARPMGRPLEINELARLFVAQKTPHVRHAMWLLLATMGRPTAVLRLAKAQVKERDERLDLNPEGRVQTKKRRAVVPLTSNLKRVIMAIEAGRRVELESVPPEEFFYVSFKGAPVKSIKTSFRKMVIHAGFAQEAERIERPGRRFERLKDKVVYKREPITPYSMRHTMARELRRAGYDLDEVGPYLGHKDKDHKTTHVYAPDHPDYLRGQAEVVDAYMSRLEAEIVRLGGEPFLSTKPEHALEFAAKCAAKCDIEHGFWGP